MQYIEAPDRYYTEATELPTIFLAGGITDCPNWQADLVEFLREAEESGRISPVTVYQPRRADFPIHNPDAAIEQIINTFGSLDVAVVNAAFSLKGNIETLETADWRRQFEVNVFGAAMTAKHALPELRKTQGRLALIGSAASLATVPMFGAYAASKYALRAIGQTLAMELHGSGVSCTVIYPGYMDTEFAQIDNNGHFDPNKKKVTNRFMWSAEKSANPCVRAIHKRKREFTFTALGRIWCWFGVHTPGLIHFFLTRFGTPGSETLDAS